MKGLIQTKYISEFSHQRFHSLHWLSCTNEISHHGLGDLAVSQSDVIDRSSQ